MFVSTRNTLIAASLVFAVSAAVASWFFYSAGARRNVPVVIYLVDTLRADRLGLYGYDRPTSPRMDALAAQSVVFEQAYAPAPWTLPSLASLVTSKPPCEHGVLAEKRKLNRFQRTLAQQLQSAGYYTAGHYANIFAGPIAGLDRGHQTFLRQQPNEQLEALAGYVATLLDQAGDQPTYLYIHTTEPHDPFRAPFNLIRQFGSVSPDQRIQVYLAMDRYRKLTTVDWSANRPIGTTDNTAEQTRIYRYLEKLRDDMLVLYDASVRLADERLGLVVDVLKEKDIFDRALVIILSDHGEEFGEHDGWFHEQSVYEELTHVPLMIRFPGGEFAGMRVEELVSLLDIMPTIFDYLGRPELCLECRGRSLLPLLRETVRGGSEETSIVSVRHNERQFYRPWAESRGDVNVVVRRNKWKGIWNMEPDTLELYDLEKDSGETRDVSSANPELAADFRDRAREWISACAERAQAPEQVDRFDEETLEELRALGYIN